jgi:hypothetical protein
MTGEILRSVLPRFASSTVPQGSFRKSTVFRSRVRPVQDGGGFGADNAIEADDEVEG